MRIQQTIDAWYKAARSDSISQLVLVLMMLALARGIVFASLQPLPVSSAELSTVTYASAVTEKGELVQGSLQPSARLSQLLQANKAQTTKIGTGVAAPRFPSSFHLLAVGLFFLTNFLAVTFQVFLLRMVSVGLSVALVWLSYEVVRKVAPGNKSGQIVVALIVTLHPQLASAASSATPLILYIVGFTVLILLALDLFEGGRPVRCGLLAALTLLLAVPAYAVPVVALAILLLALSYFRVFRSHPDLRYVIPGVGLAIVSAFVWRTVLPDAISRLLPWASKSQFLPSFLEEVSVSYATASAVLRGLLGLSEETSGLFGMELGTLVLSAGVIVAILAGIGILLNLRFLFPAWETAGWASLPRPKPFLRNALLFFLGAAGVSYLSFLPATFGLVASSPGGEGGKTLVSLVLPYVQRLSSIGLGLVAARYVLDNWDTIKGTLIIERKHAYAVVSMTLVSLYAILVVPPTDPPLASFALAGIVPSAYFVVAGLQSLRKSLVLTSRLVMITFWSLTTVLTVATVARLLNVGPLLGLTPATSLLPSYVCAALIALFALYSSRFIEATRRLDNP